MKRRRHSSFSVRGGTALLVGWLSASAASALGERGLALFRSYEPAVARATTQNFGILADDTGLVYVCNGGGLLIHDGARWQRVKIGGGEVAFSVAMNEAGEVAVGGLGDLGLLAHDEDGSVRFVSLLARAPPADRAVGQVYAIAGTPEGFVFLGDHALLAWDGKELRKLVELSEDGITPGLFEGGAERYFTRSQGIFRLRSGRLEPVPGTEALRGQRVDLILPAEDGLLLSVRKVGLFRLRNGVAAPFAPEASRWAVEHRILTGASLPGGGWALGSVLGGVLLLQADGTVAQKIDSSTGLPDDLVGGLAVDREGGLWISLNNGLVRVDAGSPLSVIDRRSGLAGSVYSVARHRGALWFAAAPGVFTTFDAKVGGGSPAPVSVHPVAGPPPSVWSLLPVEEDLLVGSAGGAWWVRAGRQPEPIAETEAWVVYTLVPSMRDPDRVWVGSDAGLATLRRVAGRWLLEREVVRLEAPVRSIVETDRVLWSGLEAGGVVGVELPLPGSSHEAPRLLRTEHDSGANLFHLGGRYWAADGERVYAFDPASGRLSADPDLGALEGGGTLSQMGLDAAGRLWLSTHPISVVPPSGSGWDLSRRRVIALPAHEVEQFVAEPDGSMWIAATDGAYVVRGGAEGTVAAPPAPLLARVVGGRGEVLAAGSPRRVLPSLELPASLERLRVELGPLSHRSGLRFETRLEPLDREWSAPSSEPFADLSRVPSGRYTFRARSVDSSGERGPEATWSFGVRAAWYLRWWALVLWGLLGAGLVRGYARLRGRALRLRALALESRVTEQTVELRATVEQLRRTQAELEAANARLEELSLQDELTGVANRRRLAPVLLSEWHRAVRAKRPIAFILLDLDHFKQLNDSRGHLEGDRCLREVARYLDGTIRRSGDLLVRYGGEEFGVLLPDTDLDGAIHLADELRAGIEALGLPYGGGPRDRLTASIGVASWLPEVGDAPETLIEAADMALYRAKNEGRNRVRAA